jgi:hypothetical protein
MANKAWRRQNRNCLVTAGPFSRGGYRISESVKDVVFVKSHRKVITKAWLGRYRSPLGILPLTRLSPGPVFECHHTKTTCRLSFSDYPNILWWWSDAKMLRPPLEILHLSLWPIRSVRHSHYRGIYIHNLEIPPLLRYTRIKFVLHFLDITQGSAVVLTTWIPVPPLHGKCSHSLEIPYTILYQSLFSTRILNPPLKRISCCTHQLDIPSSIRFESAVVRTAGIFQPSKEWALAPTTLHKIWISCWSHFLDIAFSVTFRIRHCPHTTYLYISLFII